ncbi:hypothetical protein HNQ02_000149 [Flavobacterium sp. 7E]|uniref:lipocalin family protein n=1 Tax=unclassified Flavobacterium TaxID=196869 RepID=UPI001571050C|nr:MULTISPECIES: lipocalin family protein [unclassified Flavobacterium]MBE0392947.1 hypothetical protein [Flavobacterium sp. PL002]NRS87249.1 hypothetical protein [Flavobacterium sp. 7E]
MKKLSILFLSVISLGLSVSSCSNDDNDSGSIEGKWELYKVGGTIAGQEILVEIPSNVTPCGKDYLEFVKGGVLNDFSFGDSDSDCTKPTETGVWTKTDNKLNITYASEFGADYDILELTNSTLKIKEINEDEQYQILLYKRK